MDTLNDISLLYESSILNQNIDYYILENKYNELININEVKVDTRWQKIKNGIIRVLNKLFGRFKFIFDKIGKILGVLPRAIKFMLRKIDRVRKAKYRDDKKEIVCCDIDNLTKSLDKCYLISNKDIRDAYEIVNNGKFNDGDFETHTATFEKGIAAIKEIKDDFTNIREEIYEKKKVTKTYSSYDELLEDYRIFTQHLNTESYPDYRQGTAQLKACMDDTQRILKDLKSVKPDENNKTAPFFKKAIQYYSESLSLHTMYLSLVNSTEIFIMKQFKKFMSKFDMNTEELTNSEYYDDFYNYMYGGPDIAPEEED